MLKFQLYVLMNNEKGKCLLHPYLYFMPLSLSSKHTLLMLEILMSFI